MIVDASVAIKWLVQEEDSETAALLLERRDLLAPDLLACEMANAIWKKWKRGEISGVPSRLAQLPRLLDEIVPAGNLAVRATEIAFALDHAAYDCFYLALAEERSDMVVTADERLIGKCAGTPFAALLLPLPNVGRV